MVVTAGKWYYEVTLASNGQAQVGWCTQTFDPADATLGDSWTYDGSRQQKVRNGNGTHRFGPVRHLYLTPPSLTKALHTVKTGALATSLASCST